MLETRRVWFFWMICLQAGEMSVYCDSGGKLCGGIKRLFSNVVKKDTAATVIIDGVRLGRIHLI